MPDGATDCPMLVVQTSRCCSPQQVIVSSVPIAHECERPAVTALNVPDGAYGRLHGPVVAAPAGVDVVGADSSPNARRLRRQALNGSGTGVNPGCVRPHVCRLPPLQAIVSSVRNSHECQKPAETVLNVTPLRIGSCPNWCVRPQQVMVSSVRIAHEWTAACGDGLERARRRSKVCPRPAEAEAPAGDGVVAAQTAHE